MVFYYHANKTHFHKKGFALGLVLRVRFFGTRKWPIGAIFLYKNLFFFVRLNRFLYFWYLNAKFQPVGSYMRVFTVWAIANWCTWSGKHRWRLGLGTTILAKVLGTPWINTCKRRILYTSWHAFHEKLWYCCFNSVQGTPLPPNNIDNEGTDKGLWNQTLYKGAGGGESCIVKMMRNFACAFAKVSKDFWPIL